MPTIDVHDPVRSALASRISPGRCRDCIRPHVASRSTRPARSRVQRGLHVDLGLHHRMISATSCSRSRITPGSTRSMKAHARLFAAEHGYDLVDDHGMLTDWWGYCWRISPRSAASSTRRTARPPRAAIEEKYMAAQRNVIGVIVARSRCNVVIPGRLRRRQDLGSGLNASRRARIASVTSRAAVAIFGTATTADGATSRLVSGSGAVAEPALEGATFISPSRARTAAAGPG